MIAASGIPINCGTFIGPNSPVYDFSKPAIGEDKFLLEVIPRTRIISSGVAASISFNDANLVNISGSTTITDYITVVNQLTTEFYNTNIISLNSGIILGTEDSIASGVASGQTTLIARHNNNIFDTASVTIEAKVGDVSSVFQSYKNDTLAKYVSDSIDSRILNKNPENSKPVFSTKNDVSINYIRNTGCWASDLDLTCVSVWNSSLGSQGGGTLISPRHIIFAAHFQINNGSILRFVNNNNEVISRTLINKITHPNYNSPIVFFPDITIGVLDSDVPTSIGFAKILPLNWSNYLPTLTIENDTIFGGFTIPCLFFDQEKKALISDLRSLILPSGFTLPASNIPWPQDGRFTNTLWKQPSNTRLLFFETIVTGDSGSPAFLIINNQLVLVTVWTFGGAGGGTSILYFKDNINEIMTSLGGGYSLTEIDLSGFVSFV